MLPHTVAIKECFVAFQSRGIDFRKLSLSDVESWMYHHHPELVDTEEKCKKMTQKLRGHGSLRIAYGQYIIPITKGMRQEDCLLKVFRNRCEWSRDLLQLLISTIDHTLLSAKSEQILSSLHDILAGKRDEMIA